MLDESARIHGSSYSQDHSILEHVSMYFTKFYIIFHDVTEITTPHPCPGSAQLVIAGQKLDLRGDLVNHSNPAMPSWPNRPADL